MKNFDQFCKLYNQDLTKTPELHSPMRRCYLLYRMGCAMDKTIVAREIQITRARIEREAKITPQAVAAELDITAEVLTPTTLAKEFPTIAEDRAAHEDWLDEKRTQEDARY